MNILQNNFKIRNKNICKLIIQANIFTKFGIGTPKDVYDRHKLIFNNKNESNPDIKIPRQQHHRFPEQNVFQYKVKEDQKDIDIFTYRYKFDKNLKFDQPKALMFQFHGMHSQASNGAHIAEKLSQIGITTYSMDFRGHGRSGGIKVYNKDINQHLNDAIQFIQQALTNYDPNIPKFVSGLSLGGLTAYLVSSRYPKLFNGAILYAPALIPIHNKIDQNLSYILNKIIPKMPFLPSNIYTSNKFKEIGDFLVKEEFQSKDQWLKPGMVNMIFEGMREFQKTHIDYHTPYLLIQGGVDKLVDPIQSKIMLENTPSQDKQLLYYENAWHDLWHEEEINQIIPEVQGWLKQRI